MLIELRCFQLALSHCLSVDLMSEVESRGLLGSVAREWSGPGQSERVGGMPPFAISRSQ